ncbi:hypothetical protein H0H87_001025 [Tephrocybe sp. NHM501043]|nr:hypothetical protein H0H87_001025 [Tephrocybe sp. NHM501043]
MSAFASVADILNLLLRHGQSPLVYPAAFESYQMRRPLCLQIDAQAALNYVLAQPHLAQVPIVLYGHSLGGGVAIDLASRNPSLVSAVVVSNTFTSVPDIVRTWPIIGNFSFICSQKWRSIDKLRFIPIDTPILMISGRQDEVIPAQLMDRLWQAAQIRGMPKSSFHWPSMPCGPQTLDIEPPPEVVPKNDVFYSLEMGTHNSTPTHTKYWRAIRKFVEKVDKRRQNPEPVYEDIAERALIRRWRYQEGNFEILEDS